MNPKVQILDDEQAALIWSGETASLAGLGNDSNEDTQTNAGSTESKTDEQSSLFTDDDLNKIFTEEDTDLDNDAVDDEDQEDNNQNTSASDTISAKPKPGRKPNDILNVVNQLISDEILEPFEEGDEIKTIDDVKELIKLNIEKNKLVSRDSWWEDKVKSYSPQIQAVLHYAEKQGGTDITPLLNAISEVEEVANLDPDTEEGQIEIIRQTLRIKGIDDEEIEDQINTAKDLDKLKTKADKFFPELQSMKERHVQMIMRREEERQHQAMEASRQYLNTVKETLSKDTISGIKLQREDKAKIFEALAVPKYRSLNGVQTNGFVKSLEEMQFGSNADYEHFLNIVHFSIDKESFMEKIRQSIKNELSVETERKLRSAKTTTANSQEDIPDVKTNKSTKVISRTGFKNPFS